MGELRDVAPLGTALVAVAREHRRWVAAELEALGLHVGQELLLAELCGQEGMRQGALAEALGVALPTVNRTLVRLEATGFVQRRTDPGDARSSLVYLTDHGRDSCGQIRQIWREADRRLGQALGPAGAKQLQSLLGGLQEAVEGP